jgi:hypothetical protein
LRKTSASELRHVTSQDTSGHGTNVGDNGRPGRSSGGQEFGLLPVLTETRRLSRQEKEFDKIRNTDNRNQNLQVNRVNVLRSVTQKVETGHHQHRPDRSFPVGFQHGARLAKKLFR